MRAGRRGLHEVGAGRLFGVRGMPAVPLFSRASGGLLLCFALREGIWIGRMGRGGLAVVVVVVVGGGM